MNIEALTNDELSQIYGGESVFYYIGYGVGYAFGLADNAMDAYMDFYKR